MEIDGTISMNYGGFWVRLGALLMDSLIWVPYVALMLWLDNHYRLTDVYLFVPGILLGFWYSVYLVQRYGGTPGKLLLGLRICRLDGAPVQFREAILRYIPEALLNGAIAFVALQPVLAMSDSEYLSLGFIERTEHLKSMAPPWSRSINWIDQAWIWSEFIVLMTNKKRRALHDFIAGTVVIRDASNVSLQRAPAT